MPAFPRGTSAAATDGGAVSAKQGRSCGLERQNDALACGLAVSVSLIVWAAVTKFSSKQIWLTLEGLCGSRLG
jgi:hypothetical protein